MNKVGLRENIETWADDSPKLYQFRRGLEEMQKISEAALMDERGYQWCAGVHGGFGGDPYCQHGTLHFLTWHRPYLLDFETKLRDRIKEFAGQQAAEEWRLPYWNWASRLVNGIPKAFTDETYTDGGETKPNPLYSMPYQLSQFPGQPVPDPWPTQTYRSHGNLQGLQALRQMVLDAFGKSQFAASNGFSRLIEQPHNSLHVWVSGYMVTLRSSFDPIFWCHHANVDRQWWIWQQKYGNSTIPQEVRNFTCQPFSFQDNRAEAFFDTKALGYEYTGSAVEVSQEAIVAVSSAKKKVSDTLTINVGSVKRRFDEAGLEFLNVRHPEDTYQIRVFANNKSASIETKLTAKSGYLGTLTILGQGQCPGAPGHCHVRTEPQFSGDMRAPHHLAPFDLYLNITGGLQRIVKARRKKEKTGTGKVRLSLVVIAPDGTQHPASVFRFDNVRLIAD